MTPSNPDNSQPFIYRICDAAGVFHLVAPVNHNHTMSEVAGLESALSTINTTLAAKANATDVQTALAGKQNTLTFDSTPTANSTNPVTSGGVFSELAKKLSKVEVTDLDDLSEITDSGLYGLCLNTSGAHTTSFEYFLMLVERSIPLITYTLISSTGYKKRTYHVSNGWVGNDWSEYVYATTEFKPDGIESMSTGGSAKIYTYISDLTGDGRIGIELEDHLGNNVEIEITPENIANLVRALTKPDSTPTANSDNLVTSGGVKAAIDALLTNRIPIHQVAAILPKTTGHESEQELLSWLGDGKMALVLQTARPVEVSIEATGVDDAPDGTWSGSTDISFDLGQGVRTVKNIYDLMDAQLQNDYPGERIGAIENWKISVYAKDTVEKDTACLINFYNPTSAE